MRLVFLGPRVCGTSYHVCAGNHSTLGDSRFTGYNFCYPFMNAVHMWVGFVILLTPVALDAGKYMRHGSGGP